MKKILITTLAVIAVNMSVSAQMKVSSTGNITLGATANSSQGKVTVKDTATLPSLYVQSTTNSTTSKSAIVAAPYYISDASNLCGITGWASPSTDYTYGVGGLNNIILSPFPSNGRTGIYGSSSVYVAMLSGNYAGYFSGDVRVTGSMYGTLLTPSGTSSSASTPAVAALRETPIRTFTADETDEDNVSDKLSQVQLLQLSRSSEANKFTAEQVEAQLNAVRSSLANEEENNRTIDVDAFKISEEKPQTQLASTKYGLAADQLKAVYPELVYEDEYGNVSINYIEMVPLLVQAINELNLKNKTLSTEIAKLKSGKSSNVKSHTTATAINTPDETILSLSQNNPNPFSVSTSIEVSVPESVKSASIFIYDMSGKQMKKLDVADRGTSRITVLGAGLNEGMYIYTLVADGKVAGTKKMILTR